MTRSARDGAPLRRGARTRPGRGVHQPGASRVRRGGHAAGCPDSSRATTFRVSRPARRSLARSDAGSAIDRRERILLADDNADMREYVRRLLEPAWDVEVVTNGREALRAAMERPPDLVITDVMMPELDGFELLRRLREQPATREVPVMMLSARAGEESRVEGLQAGADDYVIKPFSARELVARVETQLLRGRVRGYRAGGEAAAAGHFRAGAGRDRDPARSRACVRDGEPVVSASWWTAGMLVGKPMREALPEVSSQGIADLLDRVYATGEPHVGRSLPLVVNRSDATARAAVLRFRLSAAVRQRWCGRGHRGGRLRRQRAGTRTRGRRSGESREGRVPRDARSRAAQPSGADPDRAAAAPAARHRSPARENET